MVSDECNEIVHARMMYVLNKACSSMEPRFGENHEFRKLVATEILKKVCGGDLSLGAMEEAAQAETLRIIREFEEQPKEDAMAKEKVLQDLFIDTLRDIYFAEKKILGALPRMARAAQSTELQAAFEKHADETDGQIERLERIFAIVDVAPRGKTCEAILGILDEGKEIMSEYKGMPAHDAGLIAAAQAVEHYEIARYGTLRTWAEELGLDEAVSILDATLKEENATDAALSSLAKSEVNLHARAGAE